MIIIVWVYLVAQYAFVLQIVYVSLSHFLEKQVLYIVSTWFVIADTYLKWQIYILEYKFNQRPASL